MVGAYFSEGGLVTHSNSPSIWTMKITHLGFFTVSKGEHQGRYALLEFSMKDGRTKTSRSLHRVGVMVSEPVPVEHNGPMPNWNVEDPSKITPDQLVKMVEKGRTKMQGGNKIILWTNKGPVYDPPADVLPRYHSSRLIKAAKRLLALPAGK